MGWSCRWYSGTCAKGDILEIKTNPDQKARKIKQSRVSHLLELGHIGHVVVPSLPLLLLQLDGDATHGAPLETLHQVSDEPGNLI